MKVIISGYGKMGHMVEAELKARGIEIVEASEDIASTDPAVAAECVCIDFTWPESFKKNYRFIADNFKAAVVGTTGWNDVKDEVLDYFREKGTTLIYASNFSIGVNALFAATRRAAEILKGAGYTPSIEEIHHIHKLDAPSGTAKSLGAIIEDSLGASPEISSVREGEVPGIHTVDFLSDCDRLTLRHEAFSRKGLAAGAVAAAFLTETHPGVHEFSELI